MTYRILVLTSVYLSRYMDDILREHRNEVDYRIVEYHTFSELKTLYLANEKWADGILTTGIVVQTVLERAIAGALKPMVSLGTDNENFYRIPLSLLVNNRNLDPERIVFDVFISHSPNASVLELLESQNMNDLFPDFSGWLRTASLDDLCGIEARCVEKIRKLWDEDKIDMVICRYSSIVEQLKEIGIPCVFASTTDRYAHQMVEHLLNRIRLEKIAAHLPAAIAVTAAGRKEDDWSEHQDVTLRKLLLDFGRAHDISFLIQKKGNSVFAITEKAVVAYLTENYTDSVLSGYLNASPEFSFAVSYGIGHTVDEAMENALSASKVSAASQGVFVVDEERRLTGPLNSGKNVLTSDLITPRIREIAEKASLSAATVHRLNRLLLLLNRRELTSADVAESFHITSREASRILGKLERSGLAEATPLKTGSGRGRPAKIYRLSWEAQQP